MVTFDPCDLTVCLDKGEAGREELEALIPSSLSKMMRQLGVLYDTNSSQPISSFYNYSRSLDTRLLHGLRASMARQADGRLHAASTGSVRHSLYCYRDLVKLMCM